VLTVFALQLGSDGLEERRRKERRVGKGARDESTIC
jgi:hypothetical protein